MLRNSVSYRDLRVHRVLLAVQVLDEEADDVIAAAALRSTQVNGSPKVSVSPSSVAGVALPCHSTSSHCSGW